MTKKKAKGKKGRHAIGEASRFMRGLRKFAPWVIGVGGFIQQASNVDMANLASQIPNATALQRIEAALYYTVSRLSFGSVGNFVVPANGTQPAIALTPAKPTFQLGNILNKWTGAGIIGVLYGAMPWRSPEKALARRSGWASIAAGILGGLFDDPAPRAVTPNSSLASGLAMSVSSRAYVTGNRASGGMVS